MTFSRLFASAVLVVLAAGSSLQAALLAVAKPTVNDSVTITDNADTWTMENGIVKATFNAGDSAPGQFKCGL